ncbi:MAG: hypothetical protein KDD34_08310, partial [Bdellovibrionales bacterium]|nr:hypothetical protein [Bdellovibrionales bacterium]
MTYLKCISTLILIKLKTWRPLFFFVICFSSNAESNKNIFIEPYVGVSKLQVLYNNDYDVANGFHL